MTTRTLPGHGTIETLLAARFHTIVEFDRDTIRQIIDNDLSAHNQLVQDMLMGFVRFTTEKMLRTGTSMDGEMYEVDEHGRAPTQIDRPGVTAGFPLRLFQHPVGWTQKWLQAHTPNDMAVMILNAETSHLKRIRREIQRAIFPPTNYTFRDHLIDGVDLPIKRLLNADGDPVPDGPNGEQFDPATHTHYNGTVSLTNAAVLDLVEDVIEHGFGASVKLAINRAQESAVRALDDFVAYHDPRVIPAITGDNTVTTLDITRVDNRAIGILGAAEVWVKPWMLPNYMMAWDQGASEENRALGFRQRAQTSLQGLRLVSEFSHHPLHVQFLESEFGIGVNQRANGALLYIGDATYQAPDLS